MADSYNFDFKSWRQPEGYVKHIEGHPCYNPEKVRRRAPALESALYVANLGTGYLVRLKCALLRCRAVGPLARVRSLFLSLSLARPVALYLSRTHSQHKHTTQTQNTTQNTYS